MRWVLQPAAGGLNRLAASDLIADKTTVSFGISHHKSQGIALDRVVLDIGKRDINDGKNFTALSSYRNINNIYAPGGLQPGTSAGHRE